MSRADIERLATVARTAWLAAPVRAWDGQDMWIYQIRAILTAMREPSEGMCHAAMMTAVRENRGIEYAPCQGWQAMIDHLLEES